MRIKAYTNFSNPFEIISEIPIERYRELAKRIELQCLHSQGLQGRKTSPDLEIDKLTKDWTTNERERFRYWFRNTRDKSGLAVAENKKMTVVAQYLPFANQQKMDEFKTKRRSLIRRLRRLQNELGDMFTDTSRIVDWADERYPSPEKKLEAIQTAINQICTLLNTLRTKEVTAAALVRTLGFMNKVDKKIARRVASILGGKNIKRIAEHGPVYEVARKIKEELDALNYGTHLRRCYHIYEKLLQLGLSGVASSMEIIIQKDLSDVVGVHKKLTEVYTELLKIPGREAESLKEDEKVSIKPIGEQQFKTSPIQQTNIPAQ